MLKLTTAVGLTACLALLAGCSHAANSPSSAHSAAVRAWFAAVSPSLTTTAQDMQLESNTRAAGDPNFNLNELCVNLGHDADTLQRTLPTPDPELTSAFGHLVDALAQAAIDCSGDNTGALAADYQQADVAIHAANARITTIQGGHT